MQTDIRRVVEILMTHRDLGYNQKLDRLGVLFSSRAIKGFMFFESEFTE